MKDDGRRTGDKGRCRHMRSLHMKFHGKETQMSAIQRETSPSKVISPPLDPTTKHAPIVTSPTETLTAPQKQIHRPSSFVRDVRPGKCNAKRPMQSKRTPRTPQRQAQGVKQHRMHARTSASTSHPRPTRCSRKYVHVEDKLSLFDARTRAPHPLNASPRSPFPSRAPYYCPLSKDPTLLRPDDATRDSLTPPRRASFRVSHKVTKVS